MRAVVPSMIVVSPAGVTDMDRGPLVTLEVTWIAGSGAHYDVCVPLVGYSALRSLLPLLTTGMIGPLALLALSQPI
jgi:hypothetical protein